VSFAPQVAPPLRRQVLQTLDGVLRLGRSRATQYGRVRSEVQQAPWPEMSAQPVQPVGEVLRLWLWSDACLMTADGLPTFEPDGELLGLPIDDNATTAAFDPRLRREALGNLVVNLFQHFAQQHPHFLLLEDIHWLDEADQVIVLALCRALADLPLLICLLHRPLNRQETTPFFDELNVLPGQLYLHLSELTPAATAALVGQRLQGAVEPLVTELVYAQTQGNPFFVEELVDALRERDYIVVEHAVYCAARALVQTLHEAHALVREEGRWRLCAGARLDMVTLGLPDTVHGLVLSRLDRLPEATRLTLKVASVIGRVFEAQVLVAAHPRTPHAPALHQQIAELEQRDFARLETPPPHPAYIFKHSITQEAVYQTLLESQRQELHLAVARVLEQQTPAAIERLAHHYAQTNVAQPAPRARAIHYLDAAAWRAKRSYANETALIYFERTLALETRWEWLRGKAEVLHILGQRLQEEATLLVLDAQGGRVLGQGADHPRTDGLRRSDHGGSGCSSASWGRAECEVSACGPLGRVRGAAEVLPGGSEARSSGARSPGDASRPQGHEPGDVAATGWAAPQL